MNTLTTPVFALRVLVVMLGVISLSCASRDCTDRGGSTAGVKSSQISESSDKQDIVTTAGGQLMLNGQRYRFVGVNVYGLAGFPANSDGYNCGKGYTDEQVIQILSEVAAMGANVVRVQAYQSFTQGGADFSRTDLIVDAARERGIKIIFTLENQWDDCTEGGYKYASWYKTRFRHPYGSYPSSFKDYARTFAKHYRDEPAVLMYQLMNESESVSSNDFPDPEAILAFAREMAATVKKADPTHLLSFGTSGILKPGTGGPFFALLHLVEGIDIVEAHDYRSERQGMPDVIRLALMTARQISKPFFIGETGIGSPPFSKTDRAYFLKRKLEAAWEEGVDGVLVWSYRSNDGSNKDFGPKDPFVFQLRRFNKVNKITPQP